MDALYDLPNKYKIQIYSHDGSTLHYTYDSGKEMDDAANTLKGVHNARLNLSSIISTFSFDIEDSSKLVDVTKIQSGNLVKVQNYKNTSFLSDPKSYVLVGYIDYPKIRRPATNQFIYQIEVISAKAYLYSSQVNYVRSSPLRKLSNPNSQLSKDFQLRNHITQLLTDSQHTILGDIAIKDRLGLTLDVDDELDIIIPNVNAQRSAGNVLDTLTDTTGAFWDMVFDGGNKIIKASYPRIIREPITIKSGDMKSKNDPKNRTAYLDSPLAPDISTREASNFATRIFGRTKLDKTVVAIEEDTSASTNLSYKAIAQPFSTTETRFNGIGFTALKVGDPISPKNRLNGAIFVDKNGLPNPKAKLIEFHVPLSDIKAEKTNVFVPLDDIRTRFIDDNTDFWLVWYQRSGNKGSANKDSKNTIKIYRNKDNTGGSKIASIGERDIDLEWKNHGYTYAHAVYSSLNRLFAVTHYDKVQQLGYIEPDLIDLNEIEDINLASRYMAGVLYYLSLYKGGLTISVTNPDDFNFRPYQTISVFDGLGYPNGLEMEIHNVSIDYANNDNIVTISGLIYIDESFNNNIWGCTLA